MCWQPSSRNPGFAEVASANNKMNVNAVKAVSVALPGTVIALYAAAIFGHLYVELTFSQSTLHQQQWVLDRVPGVARLKDDDTTYCVDDAIAGRAIGPETWRENRCETAPAQRITTYSRYLRKYWVLYVFQDNTVGFKRSWVVL